MKKSWVIDPVGDDDTDPGVELCIVGRFLTDQSINFNLMRARIASIWKPKDGVSVKSIGGIGTCFNSFTNWT